MLRAFHQALLCFHRALIDFMHLGGTQCSLFPRLGFVEFESENQQEAIEKPLEDPSEFLEII